jgi:DNA-binding transcriptional regulator GbsR (MarR family)
VAIFEERWEEEIDSALSNAKKVTKEKVDRDSAEQVKATAGEV